MGEIPEVPFDRIIQALEKCGFSVAREGKHVIMKNQNGLTIMIPRHKPVKVAVLRAILRKIGIEPQEFKKQL